MASSLARSTSYSSLKYRIQGYKIRNVNMQYVVNIIFRIELLLRESFRAAKVNTIILKQVL